jgi:hypothetical protein
VPQVVTPAKAGVQKTLERLDSRLRGNDRKRPFRLFAVKMHSLDTLFYVRIKLNDLRYEIPPASLFERGETSLARHFLQLPPFAKGDGGGFSCVGATNIQVMNVYEAIKVYSEKSEGD